MSSSTARLKLGDNITGEYNDRYNIVEFNYRVKKHYDRKVCAIDSQATYVEIQLTVVAPKKRSDFVLYDWYISMIAKSGRIKVDISTILGNTNGDKYKIIDFNNAHCISLSENYDIDIYSRRELKLVILAESASIRFR